LWFSFTEVTTTKVVPEVALLNTSKGNYMFQKIRIQVEIDEVKYTKIQSLLQKDKPTQPDIKLLIDKLLLDNFRRANNIRI